MKPFSEKTHMPEFCRSMPAKFMAATLVATTLLAAPAAQASIVLGTFTGTVTQGTDPAGSDWSNQALSGTLRYDTSLFTSTVSPDGSMNSATGNGLGALTATVTIGGYTHTFTDQTSSSINLDTGASEITFQSANTQAGAGGSLPNETFYLDALDVFAPFLTSSDLAQTFTAPQPGSTTFTTNGSFTIDDANPDMAATAGFTIDSLQVTATDVPEPGSLALLAGGGIVAWGSRRRRSARAVIERGGKAALQTPEILEL